MIANCYVNGMCASHGYATKTINLIKKIIPSNSVDLFHNNSTLDDRVGRLILLSFFGMVSLSVAINEERKNQGNKCSRTLGAVGIIAIAAALYDYAKIQKEKNDMAEILAKEVRAFLKKDNRNVVNLILHSQGSDVGYRALIKLKKYKTQLNVITLGPMITIPSSMCNNVKNYKFKDDKISRYIAAPFDSIRAADDGLVPEVKYLGKGGHEVTEYLKSERVQRTLKEFNKPRKFNR